MELNPAYFYLDDLNETFTSNLLVDADILSNNITVHPLLATNEDIFKDTASNSALNYLGFDNIAVQDIPNIFDSNESKFSESNHEEEEEEGMLLSPILLSPKLSEEDEEEEEEEDAEEEDDDDEDYITPSITSIPSTKRKRKRRSLNQDSHIECSNCATNNTPLWRRDSNGEPLCNACGLFLKLHGKVRPLSLKTDIIKKRNRSSITHKKATTKKKRTG